MSEFTDAVLFLAQHSEKMEQVAENLPQPYLIRMLNQKWGGVFVQDAISERPDFVSWLRESSRQIPFLFFVDAADHGWQYRLFRDGNEVASVHVNYGNDNEILIGLAKARYPEVPDVIWFVYEDSEILESSLEEVENSDGYRQAYRQAVEKQYEQKNVNACSIFGITPDIITELETVLSPEWYLKGMWDQVVRFKQLLGISELSWMSYHYLADDEDR